ILPYQCHMARRVLEMSLLNFALGTTICTSYPVSCGMLLFEHVKRVAEASEGHAVAFARGERSRGTFFPSQPNKISRLTARTAPQNRPKQAKIGRNRLL